MKALGVLIDFDMEEVRDCLNILLQDKATKHNIIWATDTYADYGALLADDAEITPDILKGAYSRLIQPRVAKAANDQNDRTRKHAEVFTPSWIVNQMNNYLDEEWFGYKDVFNTQINQVWETTTEPVKFPDGKTWQEYIDSRRLEITCGEAPYIVSRYDAASGEIIPVINRIGLLDRKMRIVNENTQSQEEWVKWTIRAFQSVYGYEYQGDNLLIARINLLITFIDYYLFIWHEKPEKTLLKKIANIIAWNIWQMDGLKGTVPLGKPVEEVVQLSLFGDTTGDSGFFETTVSADEGTECVLFDWRADRSVPYSELKVV